MTGRAHPCHGPQHVGRGAGPCRGTVVAPLAEAAPRATCGQGAAVLDRHPLRFSYGVCSHDTHAAFAFLCNMKQTSPSPLIAAPATNGARGIHSHSPPPINGAGTAQAPMIRK